MSNTLAIAAVTIVLEELISRGVGTELERVTVRPPDKARENTDGTNQINLFLYQTVPSAAWRNTDLSNLGTSGKVPLALHLYYLVTVYGKNDEDIAGHRLLGRVMRVLNDYAILNPEDIENVLKAKLPESDLHQQVDQIRIAPQPMSLDEVSKLWTTFQTNYRISAAYEVSVVLIDSSLPLVTPLPVLTRGRPRTTAAVSSGVGWTDEGIIVQANLLPPYPTLTELLLENEQPNLLLGNKQGGVRLGDSFNLKGHHLAGTSVRLRFSHPHLDQPLVRTPPAVTDEAIPFQLPNEPDQWPAGFYLVSALVRQTDDPREDRTSNQLALPVAPQITSPIAAQRDPLDADLVTFTVTCSPQVWPNQRVSLLLNVQTDAQGQTVGWSDRELVAQPRPTKTDTLEFEVRSISPGTYFVRPRLRIDGVDSFIVQDYRSRPLKFIDYQELRIP
jgi:hypothetical protein